MCVICAKVAGVKTPSYETMKAMFAHNPDGAGYMVAYNGVVHIHKGFFNVDDLLRKYNDELEENHLKDTDVGAVFHFRISTQGGMKAGLCHPYPVCDSYKKMRELDCETDIGLAHNGIIGLCESNSYGGMGWDGKKWSYADEPNYNDTMTFIKEYANYIINHDFGFKLKKYKRKLIENVLSADGYYPNKLAILNGNGYITFFGKFEHDAKDGCFYSNKNHEAKTITYKVPSNSYESDDKPTTKLASDCLPKDWIAPFEDEYDDMGNYVGYWDSYHKFHPCDWDDDYYGNADTKDKAISSGDYSYDKVLGL